ncbi:hypothetical protein KUTeg_021276 [Tegillarca granosa]|uniref:Dynein heavy chain C-terminal domain-containing protein n=1 Tax=Tegillarca granosa TaxID=220873 RepID=A0ABQ9EAA7_TEGGR|nr:hypothetical protein KUTeg_021276 [Tegillarca granosa]
MQLFDGVLLTLPRQTSGGGKSSQQIIEELSADILSKLPPNFNLDEGKYPVRYEESMNTVLVQELIRFNRLIQVVRQSLQDIKKAITGLILMSSELEDVFDSMMVGKDWIFSGTPPVFWISGFYFTQSFLTGVLQNYARKYKIPIDHLNFEFEPLTTQLTLSSINGFTKILTYDFFFQFQTNGAYIRGLFLEGARWCRNRKYVSESKPKVLYDPLPIVSFNLIKVDSVEVKHTFIKQVLEEGPCLLLVILQTTVLSILLPSEEPESHWINRGVAALCQLDD